MTDESRFGNAHDAYHFVCALENYKELIKSCRTLNKIFGCHDAYGTPSQRLGECETCPLHVLDQAQLLMRTKHMERAEAIRAVVRRDISQKGRWEIMEEVAASAVEGKKAYPEKVDLS
jgi:hypothetical protein